MRQDTPDRSGRSLLLSTAAAVAALIVSLQFWDSPWFDNPGTHPVIATVAASVTFWLTWPNPNLVKLWVFLLIAFPVLLFVMMTIAIVSLMPS